MSQEIQIGFVQEGDRYTIQTGSAVLGDIVMDYSGYPEDARGGNSSVFLFCVLPFLTFSISVFSILTHDFPVLGNSVRCSTKILFQKLLEESFS